MSQIKGIKVTHVDVRITARQASTIRALLDLCIGNGMRGMDSAGRLKASLDSLPLGEQNVSVRTDGKNIIID